MKHVGVWLVLLYRRQLQSKGMLLFLIGIPVIAFLITMIPGATKAEQLRVVLCAQDNDRIATEVVQQLADGKYAVDFYVVKTQEEFMAELHNNKATHGYLFPPNYEQMLSQKKYQRQVLLVCNDADLMLAMTQEIVFSAIFRVYGEQIATNFVAESNLFSGVTMQQLQQIQKKYDDYQNNGGVFYLNFEQLDSQGEVQELGTRTTVFPVRGLLAIMIYLAGLYGGVWFLVDCKQGVFLALPKYQKWLGSILYMTVPVSLFSVMALFTFAITKTAFFPMEILRLLMYAIVVVACSWLITTVAHREQWVSALIPMTAICCLVFCPVFINIAAFVPWVKYLNYILLPFYYMK